MENNESTEYLNYLRVFAAFAVLMLHVICTLIVFCQDLYSSVELFWVRFSRNLLNWCVPIFVMITGVLFLNPEKELTLGKLFKKYISRFIIVILTFGTLYSLMELIFEDRSISVSKVLLALKNAIVGKSWDHMWYVYMAIGLYLLIPFMKVAVKIIPDKVLYYSLGILFLTSSMLPYIRNFIDFANHFSMVSIYIFYLLLGYALHFKNFRIKNIYSVVILLLYAVYVGLIQLNPFFINENNAALKTLGYESPVVVLAAFAVFSLCKNINRESKVIKFIAPLTFGIYIMHPVFINFCYKVLHLTVEKYSLGISLLIVSLITIIGSIVATFILRLIPFVRKYIL